MYLGEISDLHIDDSLLQPIDLDCIRGKCVHNACCHTETHVTESDIEAIRKVLPAVKQKLPIVNIDRIELADFYTVDNTLVTISMNDERRETCIFFHNKTCSLEPHDAQPIQCKSFPVLIDEFNYLRLSRSSNMPCLNSESYLFSWNEVPGNDDERLIRFLSQKFGIDWVKTAKIERFNTNPDEYMWHEGQIIKLATEKNYLSLKYNFHTHSKLNIKLELDDGRTDEFLLKKENGKDNVYDNSIPAYIILEKEIALLTSHIDKDFYAKLVMKLTKIQADDYIPPDKRFITPLSPREKFLQSVVSNIKLTNVQEVADQIKELYEIKEVSETEYLKLQTLFNSNTLTGADEAFIFIEHRNLLHPMFYNLIKNYLNE